MEHSYNFRLYPNAQQAMLIQRTFGCVRFVYNHFLTLRQKTYKSKGETLNYVACSRLLTAMKQEYTWLREVDSISLQEAVRNLDSAYHNFFNRVRKGETPGYPRFKTKRNGHKSYKTKVHWHDGKPTIWIDDKHIRLPKLGLVKCRVSKAVQGRILSVTVIQKPSGRYFVSIYCTGVQQKPLPKTGRSVGLDMGLKSFLVTSDGVKYGNHRFLRQHEEKLVKLQRQLSRKSKGSRGWKRVKLQVARLQEHIANQRQDALQKLSTELIRAYDIIVIEDLSVKNMVRNHTLTKHISDASWGDFRSLLEYKALWYGKQVVVIDRFFPSSQLCSTCGAQWSGTKDISVRKWVCPVCGCKHDRDINAAINILREGLRLLA